MRITHYVTISTFVLVALFFCGVVVAVEAIETEDEELLASYDAARETWLQNASLYGTYTFKRTGFYSEEEAHTKDIEDRYTIAKGLICKLGDKYRLQVHYIKEPRVVNKHGDVEGRSIDTIANKNFHVHLYPQQGADFAAEGSLNKRSALSVTNVIPDLQAFNTPYIFFLNPITEMPSNTSREPRYTITRLDSGRELLSFTGESTNGYRYIKEVTIMTGERIPVIEQITLHTFKKGIDNPLQSVVLRGYAWRLCDGISVPSRIRAVSGPLKPIGMDVNTWIVSEWRSDDLGKRPPTDKDFVLQLPTDVGLNGMNHYPKGGIVDIDAITDADFLPSGSLYLEQETWGAVELEPNRHTAFRWTFMILGIALIMWGLVRMYMKRK